MAPIGSYYKSSLIIVLEYVLGTQEYMSVIWTLEWFIYSLDTLSLVDGFSFPQVCLIIKGISRLSLVSLSQVDVMSGRELATRYTKLASSRNK